MQMSMSRFGKIFTASLSYLVAKACYFHPFWILLASGRRDLMDSPSTPTPEKIVNADLCKAAKSNCSWKKNVKNN